MTLPRPSLRRRRSARERALKDRLIQTRVPESLESALKDEARKRRLSVSHLIRNVLEDTFHLVDNVVAEVDNIVQDSMGLARKVRRDAERIAGTARNGTRSRHEDAATEPAKPSDETSETSAPPAETAQEDTAALDHVLAWNKVVMNRAGVCAKVAELRGG